MQNSKRSSRFTKTNVLRASALAIWVAVWGVGSAHANPDLDRRYTLESVGFLRTWDNIDGLFADYMSKAFRDFGAAQTRFRVQELQKADEILAQAKVPYQDLIRTPEILKQIATSLRVETLLRTRIWKEGESYRMQMDWIHALRQEQLATHTFVYSPDPKAKDFGGQLLRERIHEELRAVFQKVPFKGQATGRDRDWVTVDLGSEHVKRGDTIVFSTLEDVRVHPMEKTVVEWNVVETGRAEVDQVEERIAFAKVVSETQNRQIAKFQKITKILPKQEDPRPVVTHESAEEADRREKHELPKLGWVSGGAHFGALTRDYTTASGSGGFMGSGFLAGGKAEGQFWLTREFFAEAAFSYDLFGYGQRDVSTGSPSTLTAAGAMSGSTSSLGFWLGYSYLATGHFFGPRAWVKLGFRTTGYNFPIAPAELLGASSFTSAVALGIGGDLPLRDAYGVQVRLDIGLFRGASETGYTSGVALGADDVLFFLGGYYRFNPRITLRAGLEVQANGATFTSGTTVLSMRSISFAPSLQYYF